MKRVVVTLYAYPFWQQALVLVSIMTSTIMLPAGYTIYRQWKSNQTYSTSLAQQNQTYQHLRSLWSWQKSIQIVTQETKLATWLNASFLDTSIMMEYLLPSLLNKCDCQLIQFIPDEIADRAIDSVIRWEIHISANYTQLQLFLVELSTWRALRLESAEILPMPPTLLLKIKLSYIDRRLAS